MNLGNTTLRVAFAAVPAGAMAAPPVVCTENLNSNIMVMRPAENSV